MTNAMKRRGLSDVVTTVLIILLVLAAVAIIWGYLRGALEESGSQISGACLTLDLKAVSCNSTDTAVTARYERGAGDAMLTNVTLVFADATGATTTNTAAPVPGALETKVFGAATTKKAVSFSVAGTVRTESGDLKLCDASPAVTCS